MTGAGSIHPHPTIVGWGFLLGNDKKAEISSRPGLPDLVGLGQLCYIYINTKIEKTLLFFLHDQFHTVNPFNHNNRIFFNRIQI